MRLNLNILYDELVRYEPELYGKNTFDLDIERFEVFRPHKEVEEGVVYLTTNDQLPLDLVLNHCGNWICFGGITNEVSRYLRSNILVLKETHITSSFCVFLSSIFSRYSNWNERILSLGFCDGGIRRIFTSGILNEVFSNPILMKNMVGSFGALSGELPKDFDNREWLRLVNRESIEDDTTSPDNQNVIESFLKEPFISHSAENYDYLTTNFFVDGEYSGCFVHCKVKREFTKGYISLAKHFVEVMEMIFARSHSRGDVGGRENNVFVELLNSHPRDDAWLTEQLKAISWEQEQFSYLICITCLNSSDNSDRVLALIGTRIRGTFPQSVTFAYKGDIVVVMRSAANPYKRTALQTALNRKLTKDNVICAISYEFDDIRLIKTYYQQCMFLLHDDIMKNQGKYRFYGDYGFLHFVKKYGIDKDFHWLVHPKVAMLHKYDEQNNMKLVHDLRVFFECAFDKTNAAKQLSIHYNTLAYRLKRIEEIAHFSVSDTDGLAQGELFMIFASCKLLDK